MTETAAARAPSRRRRESTGGSFREVRGSLASCGAAPSRRYGEASARPVRNCHAAPSQPAGAGRGRPGRPYLARMPPDPADLRRFRARRLRRRPRRAVAGRRAPAARAHRPGPSRDGRRRRRLRAHARIRRPRAGVRRPRRPSARARPGLRDAGLERARVPLPPRRAPAGSPNGPQRWRWHQDGGRQNLEIESDPRPRLSVKVAWFLSDVSQPGRGNLLVIPGSHRRNRLPRPDPPEEAPPPPAGATEVARRSPAPP